MYADDPCLVHSAKDNKNNPSATKPELENLKVWLHGNTLSSNPAKTTSMIIDTRHHK